MCMLIAAPASGESCSFRDVLALSATGGLLPERRQAYRGCMLFHPRTPGLATAIAAMVAALGALVLAAPQTTTAAQPLVDRAAAYVTEYARSLSSFVAEERYDQWLRTGGLAVRQPGANPMRPSAYEQRRHLVSDYALVKVGGPNGWVSFRDVLEVDGRPVEGHGDHLATLFLESPATAMRQAARIAGEGERFNLGNMSRAINMPTLALMALSDLHRDRFQFSVGDERRIEGVRARALDFAELYGPTLVRGAGGADLRATGTIWIEPESGTVLQSILRTNDGALDSQITVSYRLDKTLELWVPEKMEEIYRSSSERVEGEATYRDFRRFTVETGGAIRR